MNDKLVVLVESHDLSVLPCAQVGAQRRALRGLGSPPNEPAIFQKLLELDVFC